MEGINRLIIPWLLFTLHLQPGSIKSLPDNIEILPVQLNSSKFSHLTIDRNQGTVFIGAENRLYKLSPDLILLSNGSYSLLHNIQNMLISNDSILIGCGIYDVYSCFSYDYLNETAKIQNSKILVPVKACTNSPIVEFIGTGNLTQDGLKSLNLYIAVSYCEKFSKTASLFITKKSQTYTIGEGSGDSASEAEIKHTQYHDEYKVNYKYGFSSGKYNYILTTQQNSTLGSSYISKLIRICYNGVSLWQGYTEIPIECKFDNDQVYNLVQAADVGKPSSGLAKTLNITSEDDVLFAVFSKSRDEEKLFDKPSGESALCIYSLKTINKKFTENIEDCFKGNGYQGFSAPPNQRCAHDYKMIGSDFCFWEKNMPLVGNKPVTESSVLTFNTVPTAIAAKPNGRHHDIFIGTATGHLKRILVNNLTYACTDGDSLIDNGSPVNTNLLFSPSNEYLYAMTEYKLTRMKTPQKSNCLSYNDSDTCFEDGAANCHWYSDIKKCKNACQHNFEPTHSTIPSISYFWPEQGPWEGGTEIKIVGESLGYIFEDIDRIEVAGTACAPIMYESTKSITCKIEKTSALLLEEGPVVVHMNEKSVTSKQNFKFADPKISEIFPDNGPIYGGTVLTIKGENLDAGKLIQVFIGDILCIIFSIISDQIKCVTSSSVENNATVSVKFDQNSRNFTNDTYKYIRDPERDEKGFNIKPKGIPAGGVTILIHNITLKSGQNLVFRLHNENNIYESSCALKNITTLACPSPNIPEISTDSIDVKNPKEINFSIVDNATDEHIEFSKNQTQTFLLYPNPRFHYFLNSTIEIEENNYVIVIGNNINAACQKNDFKVKAGNYSCDVISISSGQLICRLPKLSNFVNDSEQRYDILAEHDQITVSIGTRFSVIVTRESRSFPDEKSDTRYLTYVVIILVFLILLLIILHFIIGKKNASKHLEMTKKLQQQMNAMCMNAITTKQYMKRVIIENQFRLDEKTAKILKLPNVDIETTSILRVSSGTSWNSEYIIPLDDKWEFPKSSLTLGENLGEGEFGKVVLGEAKNILKENISTTVAVKMLKNDHSDEDMISLVSEMEIMKLIGTHPNVLGLLGCCTKDGALFVITEYARHGNLREFLRKHLPSDDEIRTVRLSQKNLITFAVQVAEGMEYLASIKCVHRDLAARNVLVSDNYILKIADFGLARDITNKEYYKKRTDGRLPVKWMAPESLGHNIYSTQSDVWSYGILLWEIFTLGANPYPSLLDLGKLYQALQSGYRMEKPPDCSVKMYSLMHKCWSFRPSDRPSFSEILKNLENTLLNDKTHDRCNVYWPKGNESKDLEDEKDRLLA